METIEKKQDSGKTKGIKIILAILALCIIGGGIFLLVKTINNPEKNLIKSLEKENWEKAVSIFEKSIDGNQKKEEKVKEEIVTWLNQKKEEYVKKTITANEAKERVSSFTGFEAIQKEAEKILTDIEQLDASRTAYATGLEQELNKEYLSAMQQFEAVIPEDENYQDAQKRYLAVKEAYKTELLTTIKSYGKKKNYEKALEKIEEALQLFEKDSDLLELQKTYTTEKKKKEAAELKAKMEKLKEEQLVTVVSAKAALSYSGDYMQGRIKIKNKSDKVITSFTVGILMFDAKGKPVNNSSSVYGKDNLLRGSGDSLKIKSGETWGDNFYWRIEKKATQIKACVISVEFKDGKTWTNEYFDYWYQNEKNKY